MRNALMIDMILQAFDCARKVSGASNIAYHTGS